MCVCVYMLICHYANVSMCKCANVLYKVICVLPIRQILPLFQAKMLQDSDIF